MRYSKYVQFFKALTDDRPGGLSPASEPYKDGGLALSLKPPGNLEKIYIILFYPNLLEKIQIIVYQFQLLIH